MLGRLLLLFILVPIVELAVLVQLGRYIGLWPTLALVVVTGAVGAALARREGIRTLNAFRREVAEGRIPGRPILDGLAVLVGGAFLLTPGILTDVAGFIFLVPLTRAFLRRRVTRALRRAIEAGTMNLTFYAARGGPWTREADSAEPGGGRGGSGDDERRDDVVDRGRRLPPE